MDEVRKNYLRVDGFCGNILANGLSTYNPDEIREKMVQSCQLCKAPYKTVSTPLTLAFKSSFHHDTKNAKGNNIICET